MYLIRRLIWSGYHRATKVDQQASRIKILVCVGKKIPGQSIWTLPSEDMVFAYSSIRAIQQRLKPDKRTNQGLGARQK